MFSATIPRWVKQVAEEHLKRNYRVIDLAQNLKNKTAKSVNHLAINVPSKNRMAALADICKLNFS
jgi:superfamily II DNA/RNA helicase